MCMSWCLVCVCVLGVCVTESTSKYIWMCVLPTAYNTCHVCTHVFSTHFVQCILYTLCTCIQYYTYACTCILYICTVLVCLCFQVRQRAQEAVSQVVRGLPPFTNAIRSIVKELPKYLKEGPDVKHEQFKVSAQATLYYPHIQFPSLSACQCYCAMDARDPHTQRCTSGLGFPVALTIKAALVVLTGGWLSCVGTS